MTGLEKFLLWYQNQEEFDYDCKFEFKILEFIEREEMDY